MVLLAEIGRRTRKNKAETWRENGQGALLFDQWRLIP